MKVSPRTVKFVVAGALLFILICLVVIQQAFNLNPFFQPTDPPDIVVSSALSALVFLVLMVFAFVLSRTVFKVWMERRQQKPGSRFKSRLLIGLVALVLVPAVCVIAFSLGLLNRSIDKWFSGPVDSVFQATTVYQKEWQKEHERWALSTLQYIAENLETPADLETARKTYNLDALMVIDVNGRIEHIATANGVNTSGLEKSVSIALGTDDETFKDSASGSIGAIRILRPNGPRVIAALYPSLKVIAASDAKIAEEKFKYDQLTKHQRNFRDTYVYFLALMTVLILFAAVWVGLYMSKRITVPVEALAVATREISAGNLDHRVNIKADDEFGLLVSLFNSMADRLKSTTTELQNRRHYMEVILESIPTGVISIDSEGHVHTLNRAARTMFAVENAAELSDIFKGADLREVTRLVADAQEASLTREVAFVTPGRPGHSAVTAGRLATGGTVLVVEDLTEVVRAQRASAWREVARRLAHEIKNPLTPIQLSAERISRNIDRLPAATPRVTTVIRECVGLIVDEVSSLKNLVDEFVRFARLPTVARYPNSLRELVEKTLALYEGRMDGISLSLALPEELPLVLIDPMQMKRVLINLIDNALEALSDQTSRGLGIIGDVARDGTMVRLTIEDTGRGITPEDRERLFTPYFSTRKNGTGLGLSIVSRIIADHGGYIGVEPNNPSGTRFIIELPVCLESSLSTTNQVSVSH